ncbi:Midasin [Spironucleus salmonicida]|uniref:Midasin n=1 Tax=Spironucleus salmonicida TaxID=348837 RepID=V6LRF6_9EUKA|nr:Midasin [Spironucleus salmonicida]|eukprot:EST43369.1 Midasin [Spironucleus salmonicida]
MPFIHPQHQQLLAAITVPHPILISGPPGSGKTCLANALRDVVHLPLSASQDPKDLFGQVTCGQTPGQFFFRAGPLARAAERGQTVVIEAAPSLEIDVFSGIICVLDALVTGKSQFQHGNRVFRVAETFRIVVICAQTARLLKSNFASNFVQIRTQNFTARQVLEMAGAPFQPFVEILRPLEMPIQNLLKAITRLRSALNRQVLTFNAQFLLTSDINTVDDKSRFMIVSEICQCFVFQFPPKKQQSLIQQLAFLFFLDLEHLNTFIFDQEIPTDIINNEYCVGNYVFKQISPSNFNFQAPNFALTNYTKILLNYIQAAVSNNENLLLISSTGIGKTYTLEIAAKAAGNDLKIVNLSAQTDITDLIGGFKPVSQLSVARTIYQSTIALINEVLDAKSTQNNQFIERIFALFTAKNYVEMSANCIRFVRAFQGAKMAEIQPQQHVLINEICQNCEQIQRFESAESKFYFQFKEGILTQALIQGSFILFDEVNLASTEVLEYLQQVLQNDSIVIPDFQDESRNCQVVRKHKNFRIFASMNPASDVGKKQLPEAIQQQFTAIYLEEMSNKADITKLIRTYLQNQTIDVDDIVDCYFELKVWQTSKLKTVAQQNPVFSIRLLCRALRFAQRHHVSLSLQRALFEGFSLFFTSNLDEVSSEMVNTLLRQTFKITHNNLQFKPNIENLKFLYQSELYHVIDQIYFPIGPKFLKTNDSTVSILENQNQFVLTKQNTVYLHQIIKSLLSNTSVLLEGVTSSGKSSLVTFLGKQLGYEIVRINNHENTDLQDYLGSFSPNEETGQLEFSYGPLIRAMKGGYWVILDELNLCSSEVLEALNRLLDDNSEIYISETNEFIKPAPGFALFATQNPPGIVNGSSYGGRKQLSEAFKNRFVMIEVSEITNQELEFILSKRNGSDQLPEKFIKGLINICSDIRVKLQNTVSGVNVDLVSQQLTLRDLFRVADRLPSTIDELGLTIFMLLGERQRSYDLKKIVLDIINLHLKIQITFSDISNYYNNFTIPLQNIIKTSQAYQQFQKLVFTPSFNRIFTLTLLALQNHENPTLIGDCGAGKTQVAELIAVVLNIQMESINLHKNTDVTDFVGQLRPVRNRSEIEELITQYSAKIDVNGFYEKRIQQLKLQLDKIFTWYDGPLVDCMIKGKLLLVDEISLASDSILERLNSVFETSRELTISEKPCSGQVVTRIVANQRFYCISTMNPGNDYGKKELSPALRNRMTEIYVEGISCPDEVELILSLRQPTQVLVDEIPLSRATRIFFEIIQKMRSEFYLGHNFSFSIRDLLGIFDHVSYVHRAEKSISGAQFFSELQLCYIDGLQVKICSPDSDFIDQLKQFILDELKKSIQIQFSTPILQKITLSETSLQLNFPPIELSLGPHFDLEKSNSLLSKFCINSPGTLKNAAMILRAISNASNRPILLESAPGVGKTSLVQHLAEISGRKITRINLSEHVDLADLVGQDLPSESGIFKFTAGVLLQAIQSGNWVLLDELNLANQAVLEGLNALFDHRKQIFVPETNRIVKLRPEVKIFAAQNPAWQGGGRKVLPQSFLNRFNCLFLQKLQSVDYEFILEKIDGGAVLGQNLVRIMLELQRTVGVTFGERGGPWEINLRDVYRVLDFVKASEVCAEDLWFVVCSVLLLRFRGETDAVQGLKCIQSVLGPEISQKCVFPLIRTDLVKNEVKFGNLRFSGDQKLQKFVVEDYPLLYSVCMSVNAATPVLMVTIADQNVVIDRIISEASQLFNENLLTVSLAQSTDITDILGCYEQLSLNSILIEIVSILEFLLRINQIDSYLSFNQQIYNLVTNSITESEAKAFFAKLHAFIAPNTHIFGLKHSKMHENLTHQLALFAKYENERIQGRFVWADGVVTKAIESGQWLHLANANFCSASVLDRLNSLLERDAVLYLFEQGTSEIRQLQIHKNFRVFVSYDAKFGDVSRAIRNRCFEICVDGQGFVSELFASEAANREFDNLRINAISRDAADPVGARVLEQLVKEFPICGKQQLLSVAQVVMQRFYFQSLSDEQQALLVDIDSSSHSRLLTLLQTTNLQKFFSFLVSYEFQSLQKFGEEPIIANYKISRGASFGQQQEIFTGQILENQAQIVTNEFCNSLLNLANQNTFDILVLGEVSKQLDSENLFYQVLKHTIQYINPQDLQFQFQKFSALQKLSKSEKYTINVFLNSLQNENQAKFAAFRSLLGISKFTVRTPQFTRFQKFLNDAKFSVQQDTFKYTTTSILDFLLRNDKLLKYVPEKHNIFVEKMLAHTLSNVHFFGELTQKPSKLKNGPLTKVLIGFFGEYLKVSVQMQKSFQNDLQNFYNVVYHRNKEVIGNFQVDITEKTEFIFDIARKIGVGFNQNITYLSTIQLLVQIFQHADFSSVFDQSLLANFNGKFNSGVLEILALQKQVFQQHQILTQSRIFTEKTQAGDFLAQKQAFYTNQLQEAAEMNVDRLQFDQEFYEELQGQIELLNINKLQQLVTQPQTDVFVQYLNQYQRNIHQFFVFLATKPLVLVLSYADMLLPVIFIFSSLQFFIDMAIDEFQTVKNREKALNQSTVIDLFYDAIPPYQAVRSLTPQIDLANAYYSVFLNLSRDDSTYKTFVFRHQYLSLSQLAFIASSHEEGQLAEVRRVLLEKSPFRSRHFAKSNDYDGEIERQLAEMFPSYGDDFRKIIDEAARSDEVSQEANFSDSHRFICDIGKLLNGQNSAKFDDVDVNFDQFDLLMRLLTSKIYVQDQNTCLFVLSSAAALYKKSQQNSTKNSTILAQIKAHKSRRSQICKNIYKNPYPSEVSAAISELSAFKFKLEALVAEFPADARLEQISDTFTLLCSLPVLQPLAKFLTGFEQLLSVIMQWNGNAPQRFQFDTQILTGVKATIVHWRRIELMSWNTFFDDIQQEQADSALVEWPQLLLGALTAASSNFVAYKADFEAQFATYILDSTYGQFGTRIELIQAIIQLIQQSKLEYKIQVIQSLIFIVSRYSRFGEFVANQIKTEEASVKQEFSDQIKLFQWDERNFTTLTRDLSKSHRKTLEIIRKFSEIVQKPVKTLVLQFTEKVALMPQKFAENSERDIEKIIFNVQDLHSEKQKKNQLEFKLKIFIDRINEYFNIQQSSSQLFEIEKLSQINSMFVQIDLQQNQEILDFYQQFIVVQTSINIGVQQAEVDKILKIVNYLLNAFYQQSLWLVQKKIQDDNICVNKEAQADDKHKVIVQYLSFIFKSTKILRDIIGENIEIGNISELIKSMQDCFMKLQSFSFQSQDYQVQHKIELNIQLIATANKVKDIFTKQIEYYSKRMASCIFDDLLKNIEFLFQQIPQIQECQEPNIFIVQQFVILDESLFQQQQQFNSNQYQELSLYSPTLLQIFTAILKHGYKEKQEEEQQEQKSKQPEDGVGLGDGAGDNAINDQVKEEDLSDDQLLGNDNDKKDQNDDEKNDENDDGIDMDREFDGQNQDVNNDNEEQEEEKEDLEKEINQDEEGEQQDQKRKQTEESEEEQEGSQQKQDEVGEEENEMKAGDNDNDQNDEMSDISEQNPEYQDPDVAEEFEEKEEPQQAEDDEFSMQTDLNDQSVKDDMSDVFDEIFNDELENAENEEEKLEEIEQKFEEKQEDSEQLNDEEPEEQQQQEKKDYTEDQPEHFQNEEENIEDQTGFQNGNDDQESQSENQQKDEENEVQNAKTQQENNETSQNDNEEPSENADNQAEIHANKKMSKQKKSDNAEKKEQNQIEFEENSNQVEIDLNNNVKEVISDSENDQKMQDEASDKDENLIKQSEKGTENGIQIEILHTDITLQTEKTDYLDLFKQQLNKQKISQNAQILAEKLKVILEPKQTSSLAGDFKSGKKLNLRKIIPFIASQYRKDKIWLRRNKPSKRNYNIILLVDNSFSLKEVEMQNQIYQSILTVFTAIKLSEIGKFGLIKFGSESEVLVELSDQLSEQQVMKGMEKIDFTCQKSDFASGINMANSVLEDQLQDDNLVLIFTDGIINEKQGVGEALRKIQKISIPLFIIHNKNIIQQQSVKFVEVDGKRKVLKTAYLEDDYPVPHYCVCECEDLAAELCGAIVQFVQSM